MANVNLSQATVQWMQDLQQQRGEEINTFAGVAHARAYLLQDELKIDVRRVDTDGEYIEVYTTGSLKPALFAQLATAGIELNGTVYEFKAVIPYTMRDGSASNILTFAAN